MRTSGRHVLLLVAVSVLVVCFGCGSTESTEKPTQTKQSPAGEEKRQGAASESQPVRKTPKKAAPKVEEPPPKPVIAKVALSAADRATCLVQVGDPFPDATLPDLEGKAQNVKTLYGEKLTVVCFCSGRDSKFTAAAAVDLLQSLQKEFAEPYAEKGVRVIGVSVDTPAETVAQLVSEAQAKFVNLLDTQRQLFAKVATDKLPRVYLLDAAGKILWFDIEYSRSTRRQLSQAILAVLGEK